MTEVVLAQGFSRETELTLMAAGGMSAGHLPRQRLWYLGGGHTIRGFAPGAASGDALWFGRAEVASGSPLVRPSIFYDVGWAGSRESWAGRPLSGAGVGLALAAGMLRLDLARPVQSGGKWRVDFYFEPR
jgi:hemolysin activation/secretion protein